MLRAFLRSRICWLGIPGLLFLLWAWRESGDYDTGARIRMENRVHAYVRQRGGEVMWYWYWRSPEIYNLTPRQDPLIEIVRERTPEDTLPNLSWAGFWFPEPFHHNFHIFSPGNGCRIFLVSHWLLLLVYSGSWVASFLWWQRRKRRLSAGTTPGA